MSQLLLALLAASSLIQSAPVQDTPSHALPVEMCRGYFFLPLDLASPDTASPDETAEPRRLWFIYDTGAATTHVDPDSIARISSSRVRAGQRANFSDLSIGPVNVNRMQARVSELDHLSLALGREIDGILSYQTFDGFLLTLDYETGSIHLQEGALPPADGGTIFSVRGPDIRPWMEVRFSNRTRRLLVDSGAANTALTLNNLDRYDLADEPRPYGASVHLNRVERRSAARADHDVYLGPHILQTPMLDTSNGTELFGGDVMRHFNWTFDIANKRVRLDRIDPQAPISFPPLRAHGMVFRPRDNGFEVVSVVDGTPADIADIQPGDFITHYDHEPVASRSCEPDETQRLHLVLQREGETLERELDLFVLVP